MKSKIQNYNKYSVMKGLAITGVVAGHTGIESLEIFVNYWHLPVFFFISGYFLKYKHINNWKGYIVSRFKRLIIPFMVYGIVALMLHNFFLDLNIITGIQYGFDEYIHGFKNLILLFSNEQLVGAMWFLPALFIVSIFGLLFIKLAITYKLGIYLSSIMVFGAIIVCYGEFPSPYSVWQYMSISWIFLLGYVCSMTEYDNKCTEWYWFAGSIICLLLFLFMDMQFGLQVSMINTQSILFPIVFIAGIIMINSLSFQIVDTPLGLIFATIGDFSFSIMALHFVGFKIVTLVRVAMNDSINLSDFPVVKTDIYSWMPIYMIVGIIFPIIASMSFNKLIYAWNSNSRVQKS